MLLADNDIAIGGEGAAIAFERLVGNSHGWRTLPETKLIDFAAIRATGIQTFIGQFKTLGSLGLVGAGKIESVVLGIEGADQQYAAIARGISRDGGFDDRPAVAGRKALNGGQMASDIHRHIGYGRAVVATARQEKSQSAGQYGCPSQNSCQFYAHLFSNVAKIRKNILIFALRVSFFTDYILATIFNRPTI